MTRPYCHLAGVSHIRPLLAEAPGTVCILCYVR
ncbi:MAG: hypothetical protein QOE54_161, partial [Streptosporangiaceae bacterium]|nr:hypothetical protein [Streptosporangiaceae bacterium]